MASNLTNIYLRTSLNLQGAAAQLAQIRLLSQTTMTPPVITRSKRKKDEQKRANGTAAATLHDPYFEKIDLSFSNTKECFRNKSTYELVRSIVVFKMCTYDWLVDNAKGLMKMTRKVLGQRLFKATMRATIYGQFVGGEGKHDIQGTITRNAAFGVKSILDYSAEEDMDAQKAKKLEVEASATNAAAEAHPSSSSFSNHITKSHEKFGDRRQSVVSARTHFYESEMVCDQNMGIFMDSIDAVAGTTGGTGFAAIKITALGKPKLLLNISEVLVKSKQYYQKSSKSALDQVQGLNGSVNYDQWYDQLSQLGFSGEKIDMLFNKYDANGDKLLSQEERRLMLIDLQGQKEYDKLKSLSKSGATPVLRDGDLNRVTVKSIDNVDLLSWDSLRDINQSLAPLFTIVNPETGAVESIGLTKDDERQMKRMIARINTIIEHAHDRNVRVMVDAEQTYFQTAISRLAIEMQRIFNKDRALVFNTYQCYRRDTKDNVIVDIALSEKENFHFACKFVRGAYMEQERARAASMGYQDPINPDYEATNAMYNGVVDMCLAKAVEQRKESHARIAFMLASHNEDSVRFAVKRMNELGVTPEDHIVNFGQLLGMCDQLSFSLGAAGYSVYKYVPYGPIEEVIPYLCRRAQENRAIMVGATKERALLTKEFRRRMKAGELRYKPVINV